MQAPILILDEIWNKRNLAASSSVREKYAHPSWKERECKHTDKITYNPGMATPAVFQIPPLQKRKRIPMTTIRAIANHIAEKFDPEQIILFGSHAYGKPTAWSDVDLLVVMDTPKGEMETILEIVDSLPS